MGTIIDSRLKQALNLSVFKKRIIIVCCDFIFCLSSTIFSHLIDSSTVPQIDQDLALQVAISFSVMSLLFYLTGHFNNVLRYFTYSNQRSLAVAVFGHLIFVSAFHIFYEAGPTTFAFPVLQTALFATFILTSRAWLSRQSTINESKFKNPTKQTQCIILGAGLAGQALYKELKKNPNFNVICFLDENADLHQRFIQGLKVFPIQSLGDEFRAIDYLQVFLAIPSLKISDRQRIIETLVPFNVSVKSLPSLNELANRRVNSSELNELDINDLLTRVTAKPNEPLMSQNIGDRVIMITGAGGSIGSEIARQAIDQKPQKMLLVENNEFALHNIYEELQKLQKNKNILTEIVPILLSVQNMKRLRRTVSLWKPSTIYHAAAYKHVPLVEQNIIESVWNNVFGTLNVARAAADENVENFVFVSSDKAVRPTNVMGATKRVAEICIQSIQLDSPLTKFCIVRFGNVLGSSGSVIPKFRKQISSQKAVFITHPEITRYFMTIDEAAQLVIQAAALAKGGEVFLLDMGPPIKIVDLAKRLISLSGYSIKSEHQPYGEVELKFTGLRPGEKIYEELLVNDECLNTSHPLIYVARETPEKWGKIKRNLDGLEQAVLNNNAKSAMQILKTIDKGYKSEWQITDNFHTKERSKP